MLAPGPAGAACSVADGEAGAVLRVVVAIEGQARFISRRYALGFRQRQIVVNSGETVSGLVVVVRWATP